MKKKNISKLFTMMLACSAAFTTVGCVSYSSSSKTTETVTDENGNTTTTVTETTTDNNGTTTTTKEYDEVVASIHFENRTNENVEGIYFKPSSEEDWGSEILGEQGPLEPEIRINYDDQFKYTMDNVLWDFGFVINGGSYTFEEYDVSSVADPTDITFIIKPGEEADTIALTME